MAILIRASTQEIAARCPRVALCCLKAKSFPRVKQANPNCGDYFFWGTLNRSGGSTEHYCQNSGPEILLSIQVCNRAMVVETCPPSGVSNTTTTPAGVFSAPWASFHARWKSDFVNSRFSLGTVETVGEAAGSDRRPRTRKLARSPRTIETLAVASPGQNQKSLPTRAFRSKCLHYPRVTPPSSSAFLFNCQLFNSCCLRAFPSTRWP